MLLVNARVTGAAEQTLQPCTMAACVDVALQRYPFSEEERAVVFREGNGDFSFRGSELLMVHVLFNLIKNALRHIARAGKGEVSIRILASPDANRLVVRDTGDGIPPDMLPHIFQRFYTSTGSNDSVLGAGIGLAFCRDVMTSFGGTIQCTSVSGDFTEFVLSFPQS